MATVVSEVRLLKRAVGVGAGFCYRKVRTASGIYVSVVVSEDKHDKRGITWIEGWNG